MFRFHLLILFIFIFSLILAFYRKYFLIFPFLLIFFLFFTFVKVKEVKEIQTLKTELQHISVISDTIGVNGNLLSFKGKSEGRTFQVYYTLKTEEEQKYFKELKNKIKISFKGSLKKPEGQRNFNGFDYEKYLKSQNIYQILTIEEIKNIKVSSDWDLHLLRRRAILWIEEHFPSPMSSYMTGLLFGYLGKDFDDMSEIYSSLGIIHLFALSGMQVDFFIDRFRKILLRLGLTRKLVNYLQVPLSIIYAVLTGWSASVLRSLFQKNIRSLGVSGLDNLSLSFFSLLLLSPKFLLTVGGSLTMMYAFLLIMFKSYFKKISGLKKTILESLILSLAILPLLVLNFHVFQPLSILLTFFFSVIFDIFMLPVLTVLFVLSLSLHFSLDINFIFHIIEKLIQWIGEIFPYPLVLGTPSLYIFLLLLLVTALLVDFYKNKKIMFLSLIFLCLLFFLSKNPSSASITIIDVGQGDSFLLQDRWNKKVILIDTGGRLDFLMEESWKQSERDTNAQRTLIPYLQSVGVGEIDVLIVTHADEDHMGDLLSVSKEIKIKEIWVNEGSLSQEKMLTLLKEVNRPVHIARTGEKIPIFDSYLEILTAGYRGDGSNEDSIITYGNFYDIRFLFTGDLESGEAKLIEDYPSLKVEVLKAGHHGSKTSSHPEFIESIQAKIALISAGKDNRYHHPNQEVLDTFEQNDVLVYRTDKQGALKMVFKNSRWKIQTVK
ncbi:MAG: DNA internalization-related competence protein ComEC/Rec2 [Lactovum sp.]